jgi:hypothetical protein
MKLSQFDQLDIGVYVDPCTQCDFVGFPIAFGVTCEVALKPKCYLLRCNFRFMEAGMFAPLKSVFDRIVATGDLLVIDSDGNRHHFGDKTGPAVEVSLADRRLERRLAFNPQLALGEAYMAGKFVIERGTIYDFLEIMLSNAEHQPCPFWMRAADSVRRLSKRLQQYNPAPRPANVAHHYDINPAIYELFLDSDRQYSCAISWTQTILKKLSRPRNDTQLKLALSAGHQVLDIGSGCGLAFYLTKRQCRRDGNNVVCGTTSRNTSAGSEQWRFAPRPFRVARLSPRRRQL